MYQCSSDGSNEPAGGRSGVGREGARAGQGSWLQRAPAPLGIAGCGVGYVGRLTARPPPALRPLIVEAEGSVLVRRLRAAPRIAAKPSGISPSRWAQYAAQRGH